MNLRLKIFFNEINAMMNDNFEIILMINFELRQVKILKNYVIKTLYIKKSTAKIINVNFSVTKVFIKKCDVKLNLLYIINFSDESLMKQIEIFKH